MSHNYFPRDILTTIFLKLPVALLVRMTIVCKEWRGIIKSTEFIDLHRNDIVDNNSSSLVLRHHSGNPRRERFAFPLRLDGVDRLVMSYSSSTTLNNETDFFHLIVGSMHGLICLRNPDANLEYLWNPSIRRYLTLPKSNCPDENYVLGFGFDAKTEDHKVLKISSVVEIYGIKKHGWRFVETSDSLNLNDCWLDRESCFHGVSLHWLGCYSGWNKFIAVFDMSEERFYKLQLPAGVGDKKILILHLSLREIDGSLGLCHYLEEGHKRFDGVDLWVNKNGWIKLYVLDICGVPRPILSFTADYILLYKGKNYGYIASLDRNTAKIKNHRGIQSTITAFYVGSYADSLLLLDEESGAKSMPLNNFSEVDNVEGNCEGSTWWERWELSQWWKKKNY